MSAGHIRPRGPGAWELKYDIGCDPVTGKRRIRYKTVRGKKSDAQRELRTLLGAVDEGRHVDPGKLTLGGWLQEWLKEAEHNLSAKSFERYRETVDLHLQPSIDRRYSAGETPAGAYPELLCRCAEERS